MSKNALVIVGSGLAGYNLAREFRKLDQQEELIIIADDAADFYSKPMLSNAHDKNKSAEELVMSGKDKMEKDLDARILDGTRVTKIDTSNKEVITSDGKIPYDKLVLATGAVVHQLKVKGNAGNEFLSVNNLDDYAIFRDRIKGKKHIAIIGSGLIGCEFANDLAQAGYKVSVIGLEKQPLNHLMPDEAGEFLKDKLSEQGIEWFLGNSIDSINLDEKFTIKFEGGDSLEADIVLSAIGMHPDVALANDSGLDINHGVKVNSYLETSEEDIYALGDCADIEGLWLPYVMPLMNSARALAKTVSGNRTSVSFPPMPVIVKTPACATVVSPPMNSASGQWKIDKDKNGLKAEFIDDKNELHGFALLGDRFKEKAELTKRLPALLN